MATLASKDDIVAYGEVKRKEKELMQKSHLTVTNMHSRRRMTDSTETRKRCGHFSKWELSCCAIEQTTTGNSGCPWGDSEWWFWEKVRETWGTRRK
jgi:hypothetical protein